MKSALDPKSEPIKFVNNLVLRCDALGCESDRLQTWKGNRIRTRADGRISRISQGYRRIRAQARTFWQKNSRISQFTTLYFTLYSFEIVSVRIRAYSRKIPAIKRGSNPQLDEFCSIAHEDERAFSFAFSL